jgi:hypothetical protein
MATRLQANTAELDNLLKDLKGTKGINVGAREQNNETLRFGGRFLRWGAKPFP